MSTRRVNNDHKKLDKHAVDNQDPFIKVYATYKQNHGELSVAEEEA